MAEIEIKLFGAPVFTRSGENIHIQRRKAVALLAYLVVTRRPHGRDTLAALLWPEHDQSSARAGLRRELSRLKRDIGPNVLSIEREQVAIDPDVEMSLDVRRFQELFEKVEKHFGVDESRYSDGDQRCQ